MIDDFSKIVKALRAQGRPRPIAVVWAEDDTTRAAMALALENDLIRPVFIGCRAQVESDPRLAPFADKLQIVDADNGDQASEMAVALAREGKIDVIMKGLINTDNLLRSVLNKENGILPKGAVMTHLTAAQIPSYPKLLLFSDAAVIPYPTADQRRAQVQCLVDLAHGMGISTPKVALTHCSEKVDAKHFPFTEDYVEIIKAAKRGDFGECVVDGPYDVKVACCPEAMRKKHIDSPIGGQADALVFPDIEAANTFYKTITLFSDAVTGGVVVGPKVPVVVPSRGDNAACKFHGLVLAIAIS